MHISPKDYPILKFVILIAFSLLICKTVIAGTGPDMPWDSGLSSVFKNLTGKTTLAVGVICMFLTGYKLIFGGELSDFTRTFILVIFALSVMASATSLLNILFGITGAIIRGAYV